jgi:hypothetical protein
MRFLLLLVILTDQSEAAEGGKDLIVFSRCPSSRSKGGKARS